MATCQSDQMLNDQLVKLCLGWVEKRAHLPEGSGILGLVVERPLTAEEQTMFEGMITTLPEEARSYPRFIVQDGKTIIPAQLKMGSLTLIMTVLHQKNIPFQHVPWRFDDRYLPDILDSAP